MCGRYAVTSSPEALRALFRYLELPNFPPRYNIAPTQPIATVRMVELAAGVQRPAAVQAIRDADGNVKLATVMAKKKISPGDARALLDAHHGNLREVLET